MADCISGLLFEVNGPWSMVYVREYEYKPQCIRRRCFDLIIRYGRGFFSLVGFVECLKIISQLFFVSFNYISIAIETYERQQCLCLTTIGRSFNRLLLSLGSEVKNLSVRKF